MNCKPGDLAVCIRHSNRVPVSPLGRLCTVLNMTPLGDFRLPDGKRQVGRTTRGRAGEVEWVVEWQHPIAYPLETGEFRWTRYGVVPDSCLRPIRPNGITDDEVRELYAPKIPEVV